mmetsp:Transcript_23644/g.55123  ORF Transcript_23644/g.55123 Transcript_23644/m.55123 type:complete len:553 (-) Transcript_23644:194-1852(-)
MQVQMLRRFWRASSSKPLGLSTWQRGFATASGKKIVAPPMVYISGEEMSRYTMELLLEKWVEPFIDTSNWEYFDLSCASRDATDDQVLRDAIEAGNRICSIFKEPSVTPTKEQVKSLGLRKALPSPNGAMRRGWNGVTISRDTIHIPGIELGFKRPVLFERHAVGGEYGAGWKKVGCGRVVTTFLPSDLSSGEATIVDAREVKDAESAVVVYDNPLDNVEDLAEIFFTRCLEHEVVPYVVTKKTVFKWQEGFWQRMKKVFDRDWKDRFQAAGLLDRTGGELQHLISDAATMQIIRWTDGGFGMACHNYDGDMLTDEVAQVHRSPGFITSNLIGKRDDGTLIKEFEASHGTVADLWHAHLRGEETSMNPLGMVVALLGAMEHSATLHPESKDEIFRFTTGCRDAMYQIFRAGLGTRDMAGPSGSTTEKFADLIAEDLAAYMSTGTLPHRAGEEAPSEDVVHPSRKYRRNYNVDEEKMRAVFSRFDTNGDGYLSFQEFVDMQIEVGNAPLLPDPEEERREENHTDQEAIVPSAAGRIRRWASLDAPSLMDEMLK